MYELCDVLVSPPGGANSLKTTSNILSDGDNATGEDRNGNVMSSGGGLTANPIDKLYSMQSYYFNCD